MTGRNLLNFMLHEGVEIKENHDDLIKEFDKALNDGRVHFIHKDGNEIGFLTYEQRFKDGKVKLLINKCLIYKKFREQFSLIGLREYFRQMFSVDFCWKSKRRNRMCYIK